MSLYIAIDNKINISNIEPKGFTILFYLLTIQDKRNIARTTINDISENTCINKETIKNYLILLQKFDFIKLDNKKITNKEYLKIDITYNSKNNFELIPFDLFYKNIKKIKHNAWTLLCVLSIYYNDKVGYSFPSHETLMNRLNISNGTLDISLKILTKNNLIKNKNYKRFNKETNMKLNGEYFLKNKENF